MRLLSFSNRESITLHQISMPDDIFGLHLAHEHDTYFWDRHQQCKAIFVSLNVGGCPFPQSSLENSVSVNNTLHDDNDIYLFWTLCNHVASNERRLCWLAFTVCYHSTLQQWRWLPQTFVRQPLVQRRRPRGSSNVSHVSQCWPSLVIPTCMYVTIKSSVRRSHMIITLWRTIEQVCQGVTFETLD